MTSLLNTLRYRLTVYGPEGYESPDRGVVMKSFIKDHATFVREFESLFSRVTNDLHRGAAVLEIEDLKIPENRLRTDVREKMSLVAWYSEARKIYRTHADR